MVKILLRILTVCCLILLVHSSINAQNQEVTGVTVSGIQGHRVDLADVLKYQKEHPVPPDFVPALREELEGPRPLRHDPNARPNAKAGSLTDPNPSGSSISANGSPSFASNFLTIWGAYSVAIAGKESPYTPPDNNGDVGPNQIVATANCRMKVFAKPTSPVSTPAGGSSITLGSLYNVDLNVFFTNAALGINSISDPHVRYDRISNRWFIVAIEVNHRTNNYCCIAVSNGPDITDRSSFTIFYFNMSQTGANSKDFFDYPTLGVDKNSLNIGGNMFRSQMTFSGCSMWVVNKASLINGSMKVTGFHQSSTKTDMYTPQGVHNDDANETNGYFIGASQSVYSKLVIRRVNYGGTNPTLSGDLALSTLSIYTPKTVPTLGGTSIDGGDRRLYAAMIKKNKIDQSKTLWVAQGTRITQSGVGGSSGDRDGALWLQITNLGGTPSILQSATFYDDVNATSSAQYYTYPSIAMSGQGHSFMGYTCAGPSVYANAAYAGRYRSDNAYTMRKSINATASSSSYNPGANRWGDYTQTVVDPTDDMTFWTFTQYVPVKDAWGVRAIQIKAPPPATPSVSSPVDCGNPGITITGTSTNNSEFFDPGADFPNRLAVMVTDPNGQSVGVSNVVFVSPTQITATLALGATMPGNYSLTVTNPDGQSASTTFTASCPTSANRASITEEIARGFSMQVYPNPTYSNVSAMITVKNVQKGTLELYDNLGRKLQSQVILLQAGKNRKDLSLTGLNAGIYYVIFRDNEKIISRIQLVKE